MKPNTALIKYKDQPAVNLNNVITIRLEGPLTCFDEHRVDFEFVSGRGESWAFESKEEAQLVYKNICSLFVTDLT